MNKDTIKYKEYSEDPIKFIKENRIGMNSRNFKCEILEMMDFEEKFLKHIHNNNFSITKKSRQMHMTTLTAAYCAWRLIFSMDKRIAIMCPKKDEAIRFIDYVRIILQNYSNEHFHWEDNFVKDNQSEIRLDNGSFIKALTATPSSVRGYRFDMFVLDEVAFMNKAPIIWESVIPNMFHNSKVIFYSSTNGLNFFYDLWTKAVKGESEFSPISFNYKDNPNYTQEWYEDMCKIINDEDSIKSELHGLFVNVEKPSSYRLNLRVTSDLYEKIINKIGNSGVSDYIRGLIEKDVD